MNYAQLRAGSLMIALVCLLISVGSFNVKHDPYKQDLMQTLRAPGGDHFLGTDHLGRSVLSRLIHGGKYSLFISASCVGIALGFGFLLGLASGFLEGWVDVMIMRLLDAALAFPGTLLAIVLAGILGGNIMTVILALAATLWCDYCRLTRNITRSIKTAQHLEAGKLLGFGAPFLMRRYIVPQLMPQLFTLASLGMGRTILNVSGLGFLGIGLRPPLPEWGAMINQGVGYLSEAPWLVAAPGMMIFATVFGFQLLAGAVVAKD